MILIGRTKALKGLRIVLPHVPASQLALVEKDLNTDGAQCRANLLGSLRILRGVARSF
jgi:hypothetical protein